MKKFTVFLITFLVTTGVLAQSNIYDLTDTWNDAGTTFDAIKMNVTDSASQADSKLLNLQVGGTPMFTVDKAGNVVAAGGFPWNVEDTTNGNYGHGLTALDSITVGSGVGNIAIGENSGTAITTGDRNITIGHQAGSAFTTSNQNIAIGYLTLGTTNLSGGYNIVMGSSAGNDLTSTSTENLMLGYEAGKLVDTASYNTLLGAKAGSTLGGNGVDYNILIGASATPLNTNGSYQLSIGTGTKNFIRGYRAPSTDYDITSGLTLYGPSAYASAVTNQSAGNLILKMGDHATGGGTAGTVQVQGPDATVHFEVDELGDFDGTLLRSDLTLGNYIFGSGAGASISTGEDNVLLGEGAGGAIDFDDDNVAIGYLAMSAAEGTDNIGIGRSTISHGTNTHDGQIGIGALAGGYGDGGAQLVAIGYQTGLSLSSSDFSVAVGAQLMSDGFGGIYNSGFGAFSLEDVNGEYNTGLGAFAGRTLTTGDYNIFIGARSAPLSSTDDDQFVVGNGTANAIAGYMGARSDVDYSAKDLKFQGPSAYASATTNLDGGTATIKGGDGASGSAGDADGGNLILEGGTGYGTGDDGKVQINDVMNVAASFTVATLPTGATGDVARITDGDAALAWGATAVNSGAGATPYLVWFNGTNWTILGK